MTVRDRDNLLIFHTSFIGFSAMKLSRRRTGPGRSRPADKRRIDQNILLIFIKLLEAG